MPTKLILIRHGATTWNIKKKYCGYKNTHLSQLGIDQAGLLHNRLKKEKIDKIYSSDRTRAKQTAKIVFRMADIEILPALKEINFGIFEGLTHKQILKKHTTIYQKWLKNPYATKIPQGEHLNIFKKRVLSVFNEIVLRNQNKIIAVVCHGGVISVYINHILKERKFWECIPKSASLSIIESSRIRTKIKLFNDISHLV